MLCPTVAFARDNLAANNRASNTAWKQNDIIMRLIYTLFFLYKNIFYKNIEAEINPKHKSKVEMP